MTVPRPELTSSSHESQIPDSQLRPPLNSYVRFSRSKLDRDQAIQEVTELCQDCCRSRGWSEDTFRIQPVPLVPDAIVIQAKNQNTSTIEPQQIEVMVDTAVGVSVLRGSDIYKSGLLACESSGKQNIGSH